MYVCVRAYVCVDQCECVRACVCESVDVCVCASMCVCVCVCVCAWCVCMHAHACMGEQESFKGEKTPHAIAKTMLAILQSLPLAHYHQLPPCDTKTEHNHK